MGRFASETSVPVERSRAEIEETLRRYGASEFHSGWRSDSAAVGFRLGDLFIRFVLPFPKRDERRFWWRKVRGRDVKASDRQAEGAYEQEVRQRWRALLLVIKAKLEAVDCKISTVESEFLAFIVLPNQATLGEWIIEHALPQIRGGRMPPLLAGPGQDPPIDVTPEART